MSKVILKLGNDVSTDAIYPGRFMATVLPSETPQYIFADNTEFNTKAKNGEFEKGSVIVAQKNFGCGSSREQAASAIKGYDFTVIANDFARIFLQNAINLGLKCVSCTGIDASPGDEIVIEKDKVVNKTSGKEFDMVPLPKARQSI
ncbi:MAG: 3-isopropylmalate dehydratase small subunit, partial [Ignavibacteria bacterium]